MISTLRKYVQAYQHNIDWNGVRGSSNEALVNMLSISGTFFTNEKQSLLEAPSLEERDNILVALAEMRLMQRENMGEAPVVLN